MNNKESDYEALYSAMEKIIEKKVYEILDNLGVESSDIGTVSEINEYTADDSGATTSVSSASVILPSGTTAIALKNLSNRILAVGDNVKIFGSRNNMANRYIGIKCE